MGGLQYDYIGLYPVGSPLVCGRHDLRRVGYDCVFEQLRRGAHKMTIDIYKPELYTEYRGNVKAAINAGAYSVWDAERIAGAFNFGHGTQADFERYKKTDSALHLFVEV